MRIWNGRQNRRLQRRMYENLTELPPGEEILRVELHLKWGEA